MSTICLGGSLANQYGLCSIAMGTSMIQMEVQTLVNQHPLVLNSEFCKRVSLSVKNVIPSTKESCGANEDAKQGAVLCTAVYLICKTLDKHIITLYLRHEFTIPFC